jgi:Domain of unknown function (DUF3854)
MTPASGSPRQWTDVSSQSPCTICGKPDWCRIRADGAWAICRRVDTGNGTYKQDKGGTEFWLYRLGGGSVPSVPPRPATPVPALSASAPPVCAEPHTLDRAYNALLDVLTLTPSHRQALLQRGLNETEIRTRRYRTLPLHGWAAIAARLVGWWGTDLWAQVPGFYIAEDGSRRWWSLAGMPGLLIPVRDLDGSIVALKVRSDAPGDGPKYTTISSAKHGGPGPGAPVHVPLYEGVRGTTVRLTEGELKADVTTALSGLLTLSIPGVGSWHKALPVLQDLQVTRVQVAFDVDWHVNVRVAQALGHAVLALIKAGYRIQLEDWAPTRGKGIDDVYANGERPSVHAAALAVTALLHGRTATAPTGGTGGLRRLTVHTAKRATQGGAV